MTTTQTNRKVYLVTGASTGIGKEVARGLATNGDHTVVMVSRDVGRAAAALDSVRASTGNENVVSFTEDLSTMEGVREVAKEVGGRFPRVDGLLHAAALVPSTRRITPDGHESAFATNCLAPFLLTKLLFPVLEREPPSAPSRVVFFYGGGGRTFDLAALQAKDGPFDGWKTYTQTKNAVALLTGELARRHHGKGITFNAALPGLVDTEAMRTLPGAMKWFARIMRPLMRTPEEGARTPIHAATAPELNAVTGKTFGSVFGPWRKELKLPAFASDAATARELYDTCERLTANAR